MTLILNGTDGLSDVNGTATTPAIRGTDANTGIFFPAADTIAFSEGGAEAMRIDSDGDVGIGTTSPVSRLQVANTTATRITISKAADSITNNEELGSILWRINGGAGTVMGNIYYTGNAGSSGDGTGALVFGARNNNNATTLVESMRIDSSGDLLVGTTAGSGNFVLNNKNGNDFGSGFNLQKNGNGTPNYEFVVGGDNKLYLGYSATATPTAVGNFATNGTYTATSDLRKKKDISYAFNGLSIVSQLKPVQGRMLDDKESSPLRPMFIAQDMVDVLPSVVSSIDPSPNTDNPILGIDYASIVPVLCKAIQELKATVDAQAARITALESAGA
jgi:hypothetical protein